MEIYERKSVPLYIFLSIITCGIFGAYWSYCISKDLYQLTGEQGDPGLDVLFSIITCGIYFIYLSYKWGKMLSQLEKNHGNMHAENATVFVIISLFYLGIINKAIIQIALNNHLYPPTNQIQDNKIQ